MRVESTSRRQVMGDQRHSRSVQSSIRATANCAAPGSPQSRKSRSQVKPFSASSQSDGAPGRLQGGLPLSIATGPTVPCAANPPASMRRPLSESPGQGSGATAKKLRGVP